MGLVSPHQFLEGRRIRHTRATSAASSFEGEAAAASSQEASSTPRALMTLAPPRQRARLLGLAALFGAKSPVDRNSEGQDGKHAQEHQGIAEVEDANVIAAGYGLVEKDNAKQDDSECGDEQAKNRRRRDRSA